MKIGEKKCSKCEIVSISIKGLCVYHYKQQNHEKYKNRNKDIKMDRQANVVSIT